MKTLYFDCPMGAAGDMITAALLDLLDNPQYFIDKLNAAGLPGIKYVLEKKKKCGVSGSYVTVLINGETEHKHHHHENHHHEHSTLKGIGEIVASLNLEEKVKGDIMAIFGIIAKAESTVHGEDINEIHFHEVGTLDAIADVTAASFLINEINPDKIISSPVNTGFGTVKCAHGILPIPAPATALILSGVPTYAGNIECELCTPTGAAILKYYSEEFCRPKIVTEKIGYGFGTKDFEELNAIRVFLGEESPKDILELSFNIDDMTAEKIAFATDLLQENGALDVFKSPVYMKKDRLGTLVTVLCKAEDREKTINLIFRHTSTIGIREKELNRHVMDREIRVTDTKYGKIKYKYSSGFGTEKIKPEYEDLSLLAKKEDLPIETIEKEFFKSLKEK